MRTRLTHADALAAWRLDGELNGGHTVAQTLAFINDLQDVEEQRALPMGVILADCEPRWRTRLSRWLGH